MCEGIPKGASPLCVVVGEGFSGEGPHRKGPSSERVFGYFLHEQKVTRGVGPKAPFNKRCGGEAPKRLISPMIQLSPELSGLLQNVGVLRLLADAHQLPSCLPIFSS